MFAANSPQPCVSSHPPQSDSHRVSDSCGSFVLSPNRRRVTNRDEARFRSRLTMLLLVLAAAVLGLPGAASGGEKGDADKNAAEPAEAAAPQAESDADGNEQPRARPRQGRVPENPFPNRVKAPELQGGTGWLNTSGEITLRDLRGKVVLLDFWTYCCINCIHVLPDLAFLEEKYEKELVVIGVHSAKFENEKDSENISQAIMRYEIKHPVVNDSEMQIWRRYGSRSWPTIVLIDPEGYYCGFVAGEGNREIIDTAVGRLVAYHRAKGTLDETPVRFDLEIDKLEPTPLRFPGKILADEPGNRLFISDSNHNRIVITTLDGQLLDIVGSGAIGRQDGSYADASFDHPQGMELVGEILYVADTENHMLRTVDLQAKRVDTLAGTGQQARFRATGGGLKRTALNSPWALAHVDGVLYIAMAGPHQIWRHRLGTDSVTVYAGSGREDILDGPLKQSALAQPSGITSDGRFLYVADSEGSAIRKIATDVRGDVTTVVGPSGLPGGRSLFEFGDVDGTGGQVRLQHALGVVHHDGVLYVADTYNHKIKRIELPQSGSAGKATTFLGDGQKGDGLDPPRFSEPSGVTVARGKLYIADTNNHRICVADLQTKQVTELAIPGLEPPQRPAPADDDPAPPSAVQRVEPQTVAAGETLQFDISIKLPEGYKLNKLAPVIYRLTAEGEQTLVEADQLNARHKAEADESTASVRVPLAAQSGSATLDLTLSYSYCRDGVGGLCKLNTARWRIPIQIDAEAQQSQIKLEASAGD